MAVFDKGQPLVYTFIPSFIPNMIFQNICVMAAGSFTVHPRVSYVIPAESGILSSRVGSVRPYRVVNRILFSSGGLGLTTPTRLRFLFQPTPSVPLRCNGMYD